MNPRRNKNFVWQTFSHHKSLANIPVGETRVGVLGVTTPGTGAVGSETPFDSDHTLQRIRGECAHIVAAANDNYATAAMAAMKVPKEFANVMNAETDQDKLIDITNNLDGDDFLWYHAAFCGADVTAPNTDRIDNKAKRKFNVGDTLIWLYRVFNGDASSTLAIRLSVFGRTLWQFKI